MEYFILGSTGRLGSEIYRTYFSRGIISIPRKVYRTWTDTHNVNAIKEKIEKAIEDSNFTELAYLSTKLQSIVKMLTGNSKHSKKMKEEELEIIENLRLCVKQYEAETEMKFKNYTSRISKHTKMQNAYKKSRS